ncbi:hypothetical protein EDB85DRAFT_2272682 [Lactarius pseudohatsudake]|nr:hypothetical protein EDB85DRAFT_2272682 [Lactarius pseudohatsudake]
MAAWITAEGLSEIRVEKSAYRDFATDQLNAQKAREAPRGHPWPAGQAGRLYGICKRGSLLTLTSRTVPSYRVAPVPIRHPTVQRLAPPSHVTSGILTTEDAEASAAAAAADVDLLLGSADEPATLLPPYRTPSMTGGCNTGGDAASASAVLQHSTALQEAISKTTLA